MQLAQQAPVQGTEYTSAFAFGRMVVYIGDDYSVAIFAGGTVAWRTNNPGNIVKGSFTLNHGAIGEFGRFAVFPDEATGMSALEALLQSPSYQSLSVEDAIARYAPAFENNTTAYQNFINNDLGLPGTTPMSSLNNQQLNSLANAIRNYEGWTAGNIIDGGTWHGH